MICCNCRNRPKEGACGSAHADGSPIYSCQEYVEELYSDTTQEVRHYQVNQRYRIKFERAASTKGVIGYTVEANGDDILTVQKDVEEMRQFAEALCPMPVLQDKETK